MTEALTLFEMIERAKNSQYGAVWYSDKGPIQVTKEGTLIPLYGHTYGNTFGKPFQTDKNQEK